MRIGILASPVIDLSHVFFNDYHSAFQNLSRSHQVFLAGSVSEVPNYAQGFLPLPISSNKFSVFGMVSIISRNKYLAIASSRYDGFSRLRKHMEARNDRLIERSSTEFLKKSDIDVIYAFPFYRELCTINIARKLRKPFVIEFWEDQICLRSEWNNYKKIPADVALKERKPGYAWLKLVAVSANHVVVPTRILRDRLIWLGVKKERISIVPVCTEPFTQRDPSVVRNLYNIGKRKVIFSLGSLSAYHDIDCLLRSLIDTNSKDCVLIIAGGWKNSFKEYEPYIQKIKIPVFYVGRLSPVELEYHLSCADICVANYRFAYSSGFFPATVLRYMLAGKPIVVTDLPEIREMFKGQKAGLLVRQHDHIELANTIDFLLKNEQECREMGKTAKNIGEKNYLWQNHSSKIEDVLKKVS